MPLNYDTFNEFCAKLPATSYVVQWSDSRVWKLGAAEGATDRGKVFAVGGWDDGIPAFTFKTSEFDFHTLRQADSKFKQRF